MARAAKNDPGTKTFQLFDESASSGADASEELPRDEAGRAKIKQQYIDLLGIRIEKLKGRILNRERINKTLEGIYFICSNCARVCHNLDDGLVEEDATDSNLCNACQRAFKATSAVRNAHNAHKALKAEDAKKSAAKKSKAAARKAAAEGGAKKAATRKASAKKAPAKKAAPKKTAPADSKSKATKSKATKKS